MIKSDVFYQAFEAGFAKTLAPDLLRRSRGKIPKYSVQTPHDTLSFWFQVNGKASALPYQPGEFWPVIDAKQMRYGPRDNGTVSWYQYTDAAMQDAMAQLRQQVYAKTQAQRQFDYGLGRQMRDLWLMVAKDSLDYELRPGFPHTRLFYLDAADAMQWGELLGNQMQAWLQRYGEQPETLEMHMWRVEWGALKNQ